MVQTSQALLTQPLSRASGLGRACVVDICQVGGYAAVLDMNEELAEELVKEVGGGKIKFFETNVLETDSITNAVKGALEWVKETGKEVGGVIAAAGVSTPAKVCFIVFFIDVVFMENWIYCLRSLVGSILFLILNKTNPWGFKLPLRPS